MRLLGFFVVGRMLSMVLMLAALGAIGVLAYHMFPLAHTFLDTVGNAVKVVLSYVNQHLKEVT